MRNHVLYIAVYYEANNEICNALTEKGLHKVSILDCDLEKRLHTCLL